MTTLITPNGSLATLKARESKDFRRILVASYGLFLLAAVVARLLPGRWRPAALDTNKGRASIFTEAKILAYTYIPFAFMV